MRKWFFFTAIWLIAFQIQAEQLALEAFCPHFPTNTPIVWQATTQQLPKSFWIYQRLPTQPFSVTLISNAICLAGLQNKGIPKPATNDFFIPEPRPANYPGPIPEPSFQGKELSEWLRDFNITGQPEAAAMAAEAMRHIGAAAVPFLVDQLSEDKAKQTKSHFDKWREEQGQAPEGIEVPRPRDPRSEALAGIDALGSAAEAALPALEDLLQQDPPDPRVPYVAARIGPASIPLLTRCLTNQVSPEAKLIRTEAKLCLEMLNTRSELLYPKVPVGPGAPSFNRRICEFNLKMLAKAVEIYKLEHPELIQRDSNSMPPPKLPE